jgi:hypothetical protein
MSTAASNVNKMSLSDPQSANHEDDLGQARSPNALDSGGKAQVNPNSQKEARAESEGKQIELPAVLRRLATSLGAWLGLHWTTVFYEAVGVAGSAVGKSVMLQTPVFPRPINASLCWALVQDPALMHAWDCLLQPLFDAEKQILEHESSSSRRIAARQIRDLEQCEAASLECEFPGRQSAESVPGRVARLERRLKQSVVLLQNRTAGELCRVARGAKCESFLTIYKETAIEQILSEVNGEVMSDLALLECSWSGTSFHQLSQPSRLSKSQGELELNRIEAPAVSCSFLTDEVTMGRLLTAAHPDLRRLADRLMLVTALRAKGGGALDSVCLQRWAQSIRDLATRRWSGSTQMMLLSKEAYALLLAFWRECLAGVAGSEATRRFSAGAPLMAAKLALILGVASQEDSLEIRGQWMKAAIEMTNHLVSVKVELVAKVHGQDHRADLERKNAGEN